MNPILEYVKSLVAEGLHPASVRVAKHPEAWVVRVVLGDFGPPGEGGDDRIRVDRSAVPAGVKLSGWERFADRTTAVEGDRKQIDAWIAEVAREGQAVDWAWFDGDGPGYPACLTKPQAWLRKR